MPILILHPQDALGLIPQTEALYNFRGAHGTVSWPKDSQAHLGPVGAWNIFFRLGYLPKWVRLAELADFQPSDEFLVISSSGQWSRSQEEQVEHWVSKGGKILGAGISPHWPHWLGFDSEKAKFEKLEHPNGAVGAQLDEMGEVSLWSPEEQEYLAVNQAISADEAKAYGRLFMIHGERQTPQRALKTPLNAAVLWTKRNLSYLDGNIFAGFQAWLQGQSDLAPWLSWRHRLFWLDEWVCDLRKLLTDLNLLPLTPPGVKNFKKISVVFRHDVDYSRNTSYLELEEQTRTAATYAILKDDNTQFWATKLAGRPSIESAFHYSTLKEQHISQRLFSLLGRRIVGYQPDRKSVAGKGLWRQVQWAKKNKIGIKTLHRHASFLFYPEWIDALDYVFQKEPEVLGASSLFRSNLLKWGVDLVDGASGTLGQFPDVQFPLWFPFKLAHAGYQGRPLRGWESTHIMELEPELFEQMLKHASESPLPHFVFTLGFHPAHAHWPTFANSGCVVWVKEILQIIKSYGCEVDSLGGIYLRLTEATKD